MSIFLTILGKRRSSAYPSASIPTWQRLVTTYRKVIGVLDRTEETFLQMTHLYTIINQIVFFTLCDRAIGSDKKINSIYSLMMYNVIAYCIQYVRGMISKQNCDLTVLVSEHSRIRHLAMTATFLVVEWTKAVTFIITVVFLVLSFSVKEGLDNFSPSIFYTLFTALHYIATEKTLFDIFPPLLSRYPVFDSLETLWAPVILKTYTIFISALFSIYQIIMQNYRLAAWGLYVNVILCWRDGDKRCFKDLRRELDVLSSFRDATDKQLKSLDDICSVCLCNMTKAKITKCNHLFHAHCLRTCLKNKVECPLCKTYLLS